jgi:phosphatidylglycerophosphatase A
VFIGVWAIKKVHTEWKHDSGRIVIDEVVGIFITLVAVPFNWKYYLVGLVVFRIFDIWKPLLIRKVDNMHSNWSVMLDDDLAGVYSFIVVEIIVIYF